MTQALNNVDNSSPKSWSGKEQAACSELLPTAYTSDSEDSVAPADRGKEAWFSLSTCWAVQFLIYGTIFSRTSFITSGAHEGETQGLASRSGFLEITTAHISLLKSRAI